MLHMAFCDDDPTILEQLERLVAQYCDSRGMEISCTAFNSPLELLAEIAKGLRPDVLFLDMIMPGENGITAAREIRQYDRNVKIIFLTSSSEFAVESYTVGAYYYQIKPIRPDSFCRLLDAVVDTCRREAEHSLILRCKTGVARIELEQLEYCEVIGRTLMFHMAGGRILEGTGSLDRLCSELTDYTCFLRPHRSFLINMEYIRGISYRGIRMASSADIPIPHGKLSEIKSRYLEYAFERKQVVL